jgi:hypothetical protein
MSGFLEVLSLSQLYCALLENSSYLGYSLTCGDRNGRRMSGINSGMKSNIVNLGRLDSSLAIKFEKAKMFGIMCNYGTLELPESVNGHLIVFFWPNDSAVSFSGIDHK